MKHLWACDMAEAVLEIFERKYPNDMRPRKAIDTKRRWVAGDASDGDLAAAWDAARGAARGAAKLRHGKMLLAMIGADDE